LLLHVLIIEQHARMVAQVHAAVCDDMYSGVRLGTVRAMVRQRLPLLSSWPIAGLTVQPSLIAPVTGAPSERLLDTAVQVIQAARTANVDVLKERRPDPARRAQAANRHGGVPHTDGSGATMLGRERLSALLAPRHHAPPKDPSVWPGQHYKLLHALVSLLAPSSIIEIGTASGMSTLAMKDALAQDGKIVTYDMIPWQTQSHAVLRDEDFADGRLEQRTDDLSSPAGWRRNADLLRRAEFIFVDAAHNGEQERAFLRGFDEVGLAAKPIVMFDDIHLWDMLTFWREISRPKLDLTSFGHWSGTGLVDYA
jgi:predicted O-methyltransferase YrrM